MPKNTQNTQDNKNISLSQFPKQIYVIRHGEKPDDKNIPDLTIQGVARAHYLINYWKNQNIPNPDIIYCYKNGNGLRNRSYQLMTPLATNYNIYINADFEDDKEEDKMISHVFKNNPGKIVLICWEHTNIPLIVKLIYDALSDQNTQNTQNTQNAMKKQFKYWALDPLHGIIKSKSKTKNADSDNDDDLYSLTVLIDTNTKELTGFSQSNNFISNVYLLNDPVKLLFSLVG